MRGLVQLDAWATSWQIGSWSCATLPRDLGAELVVLLGGVAILGASLRSRNLIAISSRIAGTELERPVILHEAGHLLTRPLSGALAGCELGWRTVYDEQLAWCGAGRFSISAGQAQQIDLGRLTLQDVGECNGVPPELCAIGLAIVHQLHRPPLRAEPAQYARVRAELRAALAYWDATLHRTVATLAA